MNVLIVEDEMMAQANLARALTQHFPDVRIVGTTGSVRETVLWLRTPGNSADVIFMDVELSDGDCFEIFRQADVTARVIMTTAYDNYAVRAFEVNSIDYLLKPIDPAALRRAVERCRVRSGGIDPDVLLNAIRSPREYKQRYVVRFNATDIERWPGPWTRRAWCGGLPPWKERTWARRCSWSSALPG